MTTTHNKQTLNKQEPEKQKTDAQTSNQETLDQLLAVSRQIAETAQTIHRKIIFYVMFGIVGSGALAWQVYAPDNAVWLNVVLITLLLLPVLIWLLFLSLLSQLTDLPEQLTEAVDQRSEFLALTQQFKTDQKAKGLMALFSLFRNLKSSGVLQEVLEVTASLSLLANPLFILVLVISGIFLLLFSLTGLLMLLF